MSSLPYHVTERARRDLVAIWKFVATERSAATADRLLAELYDAIQLLARHPGMGHVRSDVKNPRYLFWSVHRFVIAHRRDIVPLTVGRVLHGARNFSRLFR